MNTCWARLSIRLCLDVQMFDDVPRTKANVDAYVFNFDKLEKEQVMSAEVLVLAVTKVSRQVRRKNMS